ncbi:hypothetical protein PGTUg99_002771 [Puccinia graminis f. sp. tritici]|uniref:Uncharacterized protein n=1 Tax=Puccinia graminis f. sp. tritici TaxID=56615 RepID=A0A5B0RBJ8_PUCGR|nr:hypothetical protein PGTUg99_002771 [Puccinia graminis f. sp. tritici]
MSLDARHVATAKDNGTRACEHSNSDQSHPTIRTLIFTALHSTLMGSHCEQLRRRSNPRP